MKKANATEEPKAPKTEEEKQSQSLDIISNSRPVYAALSKMRYKDLQRACLIRGIDFDEMVKMDTLGLHNYLLHEWDKPIVMERLNGFDIWRQNHLDSRYGPGEPFVRLGFYGKSIDDGKEQKTIRVREKSNKPKRERDESMGSIYKGTKKALTFQSIKDGKTIDETIAIVIAAFPDALDKSIKIWSKRAAKQLKIIISTKPSNEKADKPSNNKKKRIEKPKPNKTISKKVTPKTTKKIMVKKVIKKAKKK